jgi:heparinase II/III-like protein
MGLGSLSLSLFLLAVPASAQSGTIVHAEQIEDHLEVLVAHPEQAVGSLYFRQNGVVEGPIRMRAGENRYSYSLLRSGQPLHLGQVEIRHLDSANQQLDSIRVEVIEPVDLPSEPLLALTPDNRRELRKRWLLESRAQRVLDNLIVEADEQAAGPLYIPDNGGTWTNGYRCPDHGVFLEMVTLHQHRCPVDQEIWTGEEFDSALATFLHLEASHQAWIQALAYTLSGDPSHAGRVRDILLGYSQKYPGYPLHDESGEYYARGGKAFGQTLDEAIWLINLVRAYDLLRGSGMLSLAESQLIEENVLRLAMHVVEGNDLGIGNIQNWHNSAMFLAALTLGDAPMASRVVRGPTGIQEQALLGIDSDGLWYEGSFGYHFYTFRAMLPMLQAMERIGFNLDVTRVETMLHMPLRATFPDGSLAMLNDGSLQTFANNLRNDYEQAIPFWPRADFCAPLNEYGRGQSYESVIYGVADLPFLDSVDYPGTNFEDAGVAVLHSGPKADRTTATVDYGAHGGFHGHNDKLGLSVWHKSKPILIESGAIGYGTPESGGYYTHTLAHNTVVIDGLDQAETEGRLENYDLLGENTWLIVSADDAYPGIELRRQVLSSEWGHVVDGISVTAQNPVVADYVLHSVDRIVHSYSTTAGNLGYEGPYDFLTDVQTVTLGQDLEFRFEGPEGSAMINIIGEPGTQIFLAKAPGFPVGSKHDVLIVRRQASHIVFGSTITESGSTIDGFEIELDDRPGDPALRLKVLGIGAKRMPFYR